MRAFNQSVPRGILFLLLFGILISQLCCGAKVSDVISKYQGDFQKKRDQFQTIAHRLPAQPAGKCTSLNPPIQINDNTKQYNTEIVMSDQLLDPDSKPQFDIGFSKNLINGLQWTGSKSPLSSSAMSNPGDDMEKELKAALGYNYLVVNRVTDLKNPVAVDEKTFVPGHASIDAFIVNLSNNEVMCSFSFQAESAGTTSYYYKPGESQKERLEEFAHSTMWEDARKKLVDGLKKSAGADIQLNN